VVPHAAAGHKRSTSFGTSTSISAGSGGQDALALPEAPDEADEADEALEPDDPDDSDPDDSDPDDSDPDDPDPEDSDEVDSDLRPDDPPAPAPLLRLSVL
jgi:hypothetical protein